MHLKTTCGYSSTKQLTYVVLKSLVFALQICIKGHIHFYMVLMSAQILVIFFPHLLDVLLYWADLVLLFFFFPFFKHN